jgi:hypothetical protein
MARSGHRINYYRRFLTLKFVDGSNPSARQSGLQFEDLGIVWRDDEDARESERRFKSLSIDPGGVRSEEVADQTAKHFRLLRRRALIASVRDRNITQAWSMQHTRWPDLVQF